MWIDLLLLDLGIIPVQRLVALGLEFSGHSWRFAGR